jgi:ribosomal protein S27E
VSPIERVELRKVACPSCGKRHTIYLTPTEKIPLAADLCGLCADVFRPGLSPFRR